jgi:hypothetical protein
MPQVTIYLPDELESAIRKKAKRAKKSLSAYIADLASKSVAPRQWPKGFDDLYGSWCGPPPEIEDPPPIERSPL